MNTTLFLIRHGELDNPEQTVYDHSIHLSKYGEKQMENLGHVIRENGASPVAIISSPYTRAVRSSEILRKSFPHIPIIKDERLHDTLAPKIVGKPLSWLRSIVDIYVDPDVARYDIEKRESIEHRMMDGINAALNDYHGKEVLMVSHGDPTAFAMWRLLNPKGELPSPHDLENNINVIPDYLQKGESWKILFDESHVVVNRAHITTKKSIIQKERES